MKVPRLNISKLKLDFDDCLIIAGTALCTVGFWGIDHRLALIILGVWLIFLGSRKGGS